MKILVKIQKCSSLAQAPVYMSEQASGADVFSCLEKPMALEPGQRAAIPTGLTLEIPIGYEIQVRPRSGLALKKGLTVLNAPGTIDSDYRGEVKVILVNLGTDTVVIEHGERVAQFVLAKVDRAEFGFSESLSKTVRDTGGFGST